MKLKPIAVLLLFASVGAFAAKPPASQKILVSLDQGTGLVEFNATGRPSALKIHGKGAAPKGSLQVDGDNVSGVLSFDLDSLDTGINLRNEHMKSKYLETAKYGPATLTLSKLTVPAQIKSDTGSIEKYPFQGVLSLHGVQKPVSGMARINRSGSQMTINADFGLKISDYGIPTPGFSGITVADEVQIRVESSAPVSVTQ